MAPGLLSCPPEILFMIVELSTTPLDDVGSLDEKATGGIKSLSLVNKQFREICLKLKLHHVRMWKKESNLAQHLFNIHDAGKHILGVARSLSIRSIGPERDIPVQNRKAAQRMPELTQSLLLVLTAMSNLTELRLVTDNGQFSIEPVLRKMFDPRRHTFPTVKSLYVRTAINMAKTFPCFPNLEAINFNLHGMVNNATTRRLSKELAVLRKSKLPIRTLVIHKTGSGWVPADITTLLIQFKDIERLSLEGTLMKQTPAKDYAPLFTTATTNRALRHIALTDERYITPGPRFHIERKLVPADPSANWAWPSVAAAFFAANPNLVSFTIGRQADFRACVFHPPPPDPAPGVKLDPVLVRRYEDTPGAVRLNYPPSAWGGGEILWRERWGPLPGAGDMAVHGEASGSVRFVRHGTRVDHRAQTVPAAWVTYPEMVRDRCETVFSAVEWLRVVRGLKVGVKEVEDGSVSGEESA